MNVKVRMPKFGVSKKPNAQRGWVKELLLPVAGHQVCVQPYMRQEMVQQSPLLKKILFLARSFP